LKHDLLQTTPQVLDYTPCRGIGAFQYQGSSLEHSRLCPFETKPKKFKKIKNFKKKIKIGYFHLHQFEHEPFWQHLFRLNDYRAQYVHFLYEKWKIFNVVLGGITYETRASL